MAMKYFLLLSVAAVFLPVLALRPKLAKALYTKLVTESKAVQEEIVNIHNALRRSVFPPARNMLKMHWNSHAAENARILARYCDLTESDPLERRINHTFCGENMHLDSEPISWSDVIKTWYNESQHFTHGDWTSTNDNLRTVHYTQIVWATSYLIGCEVASCRKQRVPRYLYVCHYCPEGNVPDTEHAPYKMGPSCGDCPNKCDDKLCTNPCLYYDEHKNCKKQAKVLGCKHSSVNQWCKATCLCNTEIK